MLSRIELSLYLRREVELHQHHFVVSDQIEIEFDDSGVSDQDIWSEVLLIRNGRFEGVQILLKIVDYFLSRLEALYEIEHRRGQLTLPRSHLSSL